MKRLALFPLLLLATGVVRADDMPLLLQKPTVSATHVVFSFADDLWIVRREGGDATRLTSGAGVETDPIFSPDGKQIAFTGEYEGNTDVYVVPTEGGIPKRLTYHPGADRAIGWTPDGKKVLFQSIRSSSSYFLRLFTQAVDGGGLPEEVPLPMAHHGAYSPSGDRMAYVPIRPAFSIWKRYRGGATTPIWIARLADSAIVKVPRDNSNDFNPMWVGDRLYFLSDRNGPVTLFTFDLETTKVRQVLENKGLDLKSASAGNGVIVYEQFGALHLFDLKTEKATRLQVNVKADLTSLRPRYVKVGSRVTNPALSPTGVRALFEARGEIFSVPVKKGDTRNLTQSSNVAERDPAWSPDGKSIAYFSDASGEYELHVRDQKGENEVKTYKLGKSPSFYYSPLWSPDNKKIAYNDKRLNLWYIDLESGNSTLVDTATYGSGGRIADANWSPDSKWLTYSKNLKNHLHAVFLHDLAKGKSHQITDGLSDARLPVFDKNGKYLYFTASTDSGRARGGIEMSNFDFPVSSSIYLVVLNKKDPSPFAPESDEEKDAEVGPARGKDDPKDPPGPAKEDPKKKTPLEVKVDLEDIDQRILALPSLPARNYERLMVGKTGVLFVLEGPDILHFIRGGTVSGTLHKYELDKRKAEKFQEGVTTAVISHDGDKLLYRSGGGTPGIGGGPEQGPQATWTIVSTSRPAGPAAAPRPDEGTLRLDGMEVKVDPRAEWKQMYDEVWRLERDFLYDPGFHGLDLKATARKYQPYLDNVASRHDLNYLFGEMLGELSLGHVFVGGGDSPEVPRVRGGLLGADYQIENGHYRFARIYRGENWSPGQQAPLTQPGVNVKEGEYLLAVNGKKLGAADNVYALFEGTAGKSVRLRVGPNADGKDARDVTVVPLASEFALRNRGWVEDNRRKVEKLSNGKVAYVYLENTSIQGFVQFNRSFFSQVDKDGVVIDERFNGGGKAADYMIMRMAAPLMNYWTTREGADGPTPAGNIYGPRAMIINEIAGSGGDWLPWMFRRAKLGPLVGKRTWGGLVGIGGYPSLVDGGMVTAPHFAFYNPEGEWEVENHGVAPDYEVDLDPQLVRAGRDPQLEKAVELVLKELEKNPPTKPKRPAYPNYQKNGKDVTDAPPR